MKRVLWFVAFLLLASSCQGQKSASDPVRQPVFAGQFYPGDPTKLTNAIKAFLDEAKPSTLDEPIAIIAPHAGYVFAGQIIADAYNQVKGKEYDIIVVLGTNHTTAGFDKIAIYPHGAFGTPIGDVEVAGDLADELMKKDPDVIANLAVHAQEHSIEVQLPFVKYLFPKTKILPMIVGAPDIEMCQRFGDAVAGILVGKKVLIIASSDLSHYPRFDDAINVDDKTLNTIATLDLNSIRSVMESQLDRGTPGLVTCACGEAPIIAAIATAKELGATSASVVSYTNSGYTPLGSADRVVGYGSVVIGRGKMTSTKESDTSAIGESYVLNSADKSALLKYARATLVRYFSTETVPLLRRIGHLQKMKRGAFVTLNENGELRGCIGYMMEDRPLGAVVGAMAMQAAFNDPRFQPLREDELSKAEIEISVLTLFTRVKSADDIVLGRDGVVIKKGDKQGVFLPQVATETGWTKDVFLDQLCHKAGLESGDWKNAELFTFQADVFSEPKNH